MQSLLQLRLVDQLKLWLEPLLLGNGKRRFAGGTRAAARRLTTSVTYPNGVLQLAYKPAGLPTYATMGVEA